MKINAIYHETIDSAVRTVGNKKGNEELTIFPTTGKAWIMFSEHKGGIDIAIANDKDEIIFEGTFKRLIKKLK